jgi:hypothetical protein
MIVSNDIIVKALINYWLIPLKQGRQLFVIEPGALSPLFSAGVAHARALLRLLLVRPEIVEQLLE